MTFSGHQAPKGTHFRWISNPLFEYTAQKMKANLQNGKKHSNNLFGVFDHFVG